MEQERYEIMVDVDDDVAMDDEGGQQHMSMHRLKSTVTQRRGRGFSEQYLPGDALSSISTFDKLLDGNQGEQMTLPSGGALAERSVEGWVVFAVGIHEEASEEDVRDLFLDHGRVKDVKLPLDHRTGYVKGYAVVEFREYREARAAIDSLDGRPFMGVPIKVDFSFLRSHAHH